MKNKTDGSREKTIQRVLTVLVLFICIGIGSLFAGDVTFFGPKQYTRNKGKPVTETDTFICPPGYTGSGFTLHLINGDSLGNNRVSSAVLKVNDIEVIGPSAFNQKTAVIERNLSLNTTNTISVELRGKPGGFIILTLKKFVPDPVITQFSAVPDTVNFPGKSQLSWQTLNCDEIELSGVGQVAPGGSLEVSTSVPETTFQLTGKNLSSTVSKSVTITTLFPVPTVTLQASPLYRKPGESSTLTWTSFAAHTVTIEPGIGNVELNGNRSVTLSDSTTLRLRPLVMVGLKQPRPRLLLTGLIPK